jgi:hypothetical protein
LTHSRNYSLSLQVEECPERTKAKGSWMESCRRRSKIFGDGTESGTSRWGDRGLRLGAERAAMKDGEVVRDPASQGGSGS